MAILAAKDVWHRFDRRPEYVVRDVSLEIRQGEAVGLVGESGSGKTTLSRILLGTLKPSRGEITSPPLRPGARVPLAAVFQDVSGSIDPLYRVRRVIQEGSALPSRAERRAQTDRLLEQVSLSRECGDHLAHELSGGQRQRVAIARALSTGASTLILDEPTSALDAHVRLQSVDLLNRLRAEQELTYLVISHDFQTIGRLCSRVLVMLQGRLVEEGPTDQVLSSPSHAYTQALVRASRMETASNSPDGRTSAGCIPEAERRTPA